MVRIESAAQLLSFVHWQGLLILSPWDLYHNNDINGLNIVWRRHIFLFSFWSSFRLSPLLGVWVRLHLWGHEKEMADELMHMHNILSIVQYVCEWKWSELQAEHLFTINNAREKTPFQNVLDECYHNIIQEVCSQWQIVVYGPRATRRSVDMTRRVDTTLVEVEPKLCPETSCNQAIAKFYPFRQYRPPSCKTSELHHCSKMKCNDRTKPR